MTDKKIRPGLTGLVCSAALMALAGCGGGGGGGDGVAASTMPEAAALLDANGNLVAEADAVRKPGSPSLTRSQGANGADATAGNITTTAASTWSGAAPTFADCEMFPANAIFNTRIDDVSRFPAHARSAEWIGMVGRDLPFRTDWGTTDNPADAGRYFGLPINVVDAGTTQWPVVSYDFGTSGAFWGTGYPHVSDCAVADGQGGFRIQRNCEGIPADQRRFPFPTSGVLKQGGDCNDPNSCGDHHVLMLERGACRIWESWFTYNLSGQWYSLASAAWDLKSLAMRPWGWGSSNAAGLPIIPLLARAAEANSGEIRHALSVAFRGSALSNNVLWPGRFAAEGANAGGIPFGALLRLRADFVIPDNWTTQAKAVATATKRYGMYVSDKGEDFHVGGEPNSAWNSETTFQMQGIKMSDMEIVDLGSIYNDPRFNPDSMQAGW